MADSLDFTIIYEPGEDGWILARVAELPSVLTQGCTQEEARAMVLSALRDWFSFHRLGAAAAEAASIGFMAHVHALKVVLGDDHNARLTRMAERIAVDRDELAGSLLASVIDGAETDGGELTRVLDSIPGAWEQAELGRAQGLAGETTPLDQL